MRNKWSEKGTFGGSKLRPATVFDDHSDPTLQNVSQKISGKTSFITGEIRSSENAIWKGGK